MNYWHKYPFVRILTSFLTGILLAEQWHLLAWDTKPLQLMALVLLLLFGSLYFHFRINYSNRLVYGMLSMIALVALGYLWHDVYNSFHMNNHFSKEDTTNTTFIAKFGEVPIEKENSYKSILNVEYLLHEDSTTIAAKGKILAYFAKHPSLKDVSSGDGLVFNSTVQRLEEVKNPDAFDYGLYLEKKGIYHRTFIRASDFEILGSESQGIRHTAENIRKNLAESLRSRELSPHAFSLVSALVLGYDQFLEKDMRDWYSNAGVMHILCVSGLHVGIIYLVLMFLFGLLPFKSRVYHVIKMVMVIVLIWMYALITGMEPAVMRASVMFSMVAAGKLLQRKTRIYNTLAASAFLMLLINPNMISWVGFQMSYLAVFGIVWLQPHIRNWWVPGNKLLSYFWELVAVSVAAQLILFPLLIFYFHKVSLVFFITNLFAIPMATVLIYGTLLFLALQWWNPVSDFIIDMLNYSAKALNFLTENISGWPGAYIDNIWIQSWHLVLIYGALLLVLLWLIKSKKYVFHSLLTVIVVSFIVMTGVELKRSQNNKFVLYHLKDGLAMDFISGDSTLFLADSLVLSDRETLDFQVASTWRTSYVTPKTCCYEVMKNYTDKYLSYQKPFLLFNSDIYFILDKMPQIKPKKKITVDYLVIKGKPWINIDQLMAAFQIRKKILISGSTPKWLADKWRKELAARQVSVYSTHNQGALVINYH